MLSTQSLQLKCFCFAFVLIVGFALITTGMADQHASMPSGDASIVSPNAKLALLFSDAFFTEGAAVAPDGTVYFSDITFTHSSGMQAGHIWKYDPMTGTASVFRSPSGMSNGIKFDAQGRMIVAEGADFGGRRVIRTDMATGKSEIIAGLYEGTTV